jgi:thymidylate synthase
VSKRTGYEIGTYYHFAHNLHLYDDQLPDHKKLTNSLEKLRKLAAQNTLTSRARKYG